MRITELALLTAVLCLVPGRLQAQPPDSAPDDPAPTETPAESEAPSEEGEPAPSGPDTVLDPEPDPELAPEPADEAEEPAPELEYEATELDDYAEMSLEELLSVQIVEAASRREQSIHDAPSSVSLLTYEQIESMRGLNPAHPFRRLLGVHVVHWGNNHYRVAVRTAPGTSSNQDLVLVDGRNAVENTVGLSPWTWMALAPEEMERAEVIRGPGSTLYGANAIGGVISIRTRRPLDHPGFEGRVRSGLFYLPDSGAVPDDDYYLESVGLGYAAYNYANDARTVGARFSFGARSSRDPVSHLTLPDQHGQASYHATAGLQIRPAEDAELYATASHSSAEYFDPTSGDALPTTTLLREQAITVNYNHTGLLDDMVAVRATADFTRLDRESAVPATSLSYHGLVQGDLSLWEGRNVLTVGGEFTRVSNEVFGLEPTFTTLSLMVQDELRLFADRFVISVASRFDRIGYTSGLAGVTDAEVDSVYRYANPRGALIWKFLEGHDLRVTVARGFRTPTPNESAIGAFVEPTNPSDPLRAVIVPNPSLAPTEAQMIELGYRGDFLDRVRVEAVLAFTRRKDPAVLREPLSLPLVFVNGPDSDEIRTEIGATVVLAPGAEAFANYVFTHTNERTTILPHRLTFGASGRFRGGYFVQGDVDTSPSWTSSSLSTVGGSPILGTVLVDIPYLLDVNVRAGRRFLDDKVEIFIEGWNIGAFFRDQDALLRTRMPFGSPIGATALVGIGLRNE